MRFKEILKQVQDDVGAFIRRFKEIRNQVQDNAGAFIMRFKEFLKSVQDDHWEMRKLIMNCPHLQVWP